MLRAVFEHVETPAADLALDSRNLARCKREARRRTGLT
jgi:hypothetical protein